MYTLTSFDPQQFLTQYWQKKPLVLKGLLADFQDPLDQDELAGLAMEPEIDARIITHSDNGWQLHQGPFEDFTPLCQGQWSLLVQSVDSYSEQADALMNAFDFIPYWRMDDLMVSFSVAGAGVGPHIDQYDVFIIQGKGSRRWQVGLPGQFTAITPHPHLAQIEDFSAVIDQVLYPGDVLYIPPGHPHNGVALEQCMNYSVGMRAPAQKELFSSFADYLLAQQTDAQRYADPALEPRQQPAEIKQREVNKIRRLMQQMIDSPHFSHWIAHQASIGREQPGYYPPAESCWTAQAVEVMLLEGVCFIRAPGIRPVYVEPDWQREEPLTFFIHEQDFTVPAHYRQTVVNFLNTPNWRLPLEENYCQAGYFAELLSTLINAGYWYPAE